MPDALHHPVQTSGDALDQGTRRLLIRDFVTRADIGIYEHEKGRPQRVRINLELDVAELGDPQDKWENVTCYGEVLDQIRGIIAAGRVNLVETLAERIAETALAARGARRARVRVEKLDLFDDVAAVGVEIVRYAPYC